MITGVLDSLEREEAEELIKKYAVRVSAQVSKKTNYMVIGDEAGPSKIAKVWQQIRTEINLYLQFNYRMFLK